MELSEFFEQAINSQRDDLLFQDKLTSKNESSLNDYSFSEQLNIIGIYSSKFLIQVIKKIYLLKKNIHHMIQKIYPQFYQIMKKMIII